MWKALPSLVPKRTIRVTRLVVCALVVGILIDIGIAMHDLYANDMINTATTRAWNWHNVCTANTQYALEYSNSVGPTTSLALSRGDKSRNLKHDIQEWTSAVSTDVGFYDLCRQRTGWLAYSQHWYGILIVIGSRTNIGYGFWQFSGFDPLDGSFLGVAEHWNKHHRGSRLFLFEFLSGSGRLMSVLADEILRMHSIIQLALFAGVLIFTVITLRSVLVSMWTNGPVDFASNHKQTDSDWHPAPELDSPNNYAFNVLALRNKQYGSGNVRNFSCIDIQKEQNTCLSDENTKSDGCTIGAEYLKDIRQRLVLHSHKDRV
jgi:hypothetical protein